MSIRIEHPSKDYGPPHRLSSTAHTITRSIDSDTRYTCLLPPDWNGRLVVYTQPSSPPSLPDSLCQEWLNRGYAFAIARYPEAQPDQADHHRQQLRSFFVRRCGTPQHVYEMRDVPRQNPAL